MFRRRRPLLRAAVVGGCAYMAGKSHARQSMERQQVEEEQNTRIDDVEQQQAQAPAQAPAQSSPMIERPAKKFGTPAITRRGMAHRCWQPWPAADSY